MSASGPPPDDPAAIWTPGPLPTGATPKVPADVADAPSSGSDVATGASVWSPNGASGTADGASPWNRDGSSGPEATPSGPDSEPEAPSWAAGGTAARVGDSAWGPVRGPESSSTLDLGSSGARAALPGRRNPSTPAPPASGESPWPALAGRADPQADLPEARSPFGAPSLPGPADDLAPFGNPPHPRPNDDLAPFGIPPIPGSGDDLSPFGGPQRPEPADERSPFGGSPGRGPGEGISPFGQPQADGRTAFAGPQGRGSGEGRSPFGGPPIPGPGEGLPPLARRHSSGPTDDRSGFGTPPAGQLETHSGLAGLHIGQAEGRTGFAGSSAGHPEARPTVGGAPGAAGAEDGGSPFAGVQTLDLRPRVEPEAQFHAGLPIEPEPASVGAHDQTDGAPPAGTAARALPVIVLVALVVVLGAGLAWAVTTHDPSERDRAASVDGVDPTNDPPSTDDIVHVDVTAVENPSGVQLDWDGGADGEQVVLVLSETEEPRLLEASTGTALLVPGDSLITNMGYCFVVATTSSPTPTPALIASDLPDEALSPPGCIRGASPSSVRR